jgi:hypothetical protein
MTSRSDDDKAWRGPRTVSALVPGIVRPAFKRRAPAAAQVMADWDAIVGPAIAAVTQPKRLSAGTLTIACAGPIAMELQHLAGPLIERINGAIGRVVVERLRFTQDHGAPPPPPPPGARPCSPPRPASPASPTTSSAPRWNASAPPSSPASPGADGRGLHEAAIMLSTTTYRGDHG